MTALVFASLRNTPGLNKRTGKPWRDADEFHGEARDFVKRLVLERGVALFDNRDEMGERRAAILQHVRVVEPGALSLLAFFCHGWPDGIQAGFKCEHVRGLAKELKAVAAPELTVVLYCCSTGDDRDPTTAQRQPGPGGDGGFADRLRDELCELGVAATVFAHETAGHTTRNPYVRVFRPDERAGGHWLVEPWSELWAAWRRRLHKTDLRFRFPFLPQELLEEELRS